ncbi:MAG: hypothetical protein V4616_00275 [Bacteroidota bacterium]
MNTKHILLLWVSTLLTHFAVGQPRVTALDSFRITEKKMSHCVANGELQDRFGKLYFPNYRYNTIGICEMGNRETRVIDLKPTFRQAKELFYQTMNTNQRVDSLYHSNSLPEQREDFLSFEIPAENQAMIMFRMPILEEMKDNNGNEFFYVPTFFMMNLDLVTLKFTLTKIQKPGVEHAIAVDHGGVKLLEEAGVYYISIREVDVKDPENIKLFAAYRLDTALNQLTFTGLGVPRIDERFNTTGLGYNFNNFRIFTYRNKLHYIYSVAGIGYELASGKQLFAVNTKGFTNDYKYTGIASYTCFPGWMEHITNMNGDLYFITLEQTKDKKGNCHENRTLYRYSEAGLESKGKIVLPFGAWYYINRDVLYSFSTSDDGESTIRSWKLSL